MLQMSFCCSCRFSFQFQLPFTSPGICPARAAAPRSCVITKSRGLKLGAELDKWHDGGAVELYGYIALEC